jgi:hypothetical protein
LMMVYNGGSWQNAGSSVNGTAARFKFVATASQTAFTGTDANGETLAYDSGYIDVYLNGVHLDPSDYTATDGSTITLASGAAAGDELYVVAFGTFTLATHYTSAQVDALLADIDATALTDSDGNTVVDASSGNVGIGTTPSGSKLHLRNDTSSTYIRFQNSSASDIYVGASESNLVAFNGGSERMRIDSSGNLLVGKTVTASSTVGAVIGESGYITTTRDSAEAARFTRLTSDGDIVSFRKDGTTVGSIATQGGDIQLGTGVVGIRFKDNDNAIQPQDLTTSSARDAATDLGQSNARFKDLYLSGGVYLGGTGSANLLDDYEEGLWTPSIVQTGFTYSYQVGRYVKIGNQVTLWYYIQATGTNTSSSTAQLTGIPFNVVGSSSIERLYGNQAAHETGLNLAGGLTHPSLQSENSTNASYLLWYDTAKRNSSTMFPSDFVVSGTISYRTS